jgi:hypothetical protein
MIFIRISSFTALIPPTSANLIVGRSNSTGSSGFRTGAACFGPGAKEG